MGHSNNIPEATRSEAQYKLLIFEAISKSAFEDAFMEAIRQVADALHTPSVVQALAEPEQILIGLAGAANALEVEDVEAALETATSVKSKVGQTQTFSMVASHMACRNWPLDKTMQVIKSIPHYEFANEVLRNVLLSKILRQDFDAARLLLPDVSPNIRRGLKPQIDFVERNLDSLDKAQKRARDLVHPDDIALNLALVAGALEKYGWMSQFSRSVAPQIKIGTHTTYATSLACAGKLFEAVALMENIQDDAHQYYLWLANLAINFPLSGREADIVLDTFAEADAYEGALAYWHHKVVSALVAQDMDKVSAALGTITNNHLRDALAKLMADFCHAVETTSKD